MLRLQIREPSGIQSENLKGILLSLFTTIEEVITRQRKGSYLVHFYQERLNKSERRILISVLNQLQSQLIEEKKGPQGISENSDGTPLPSRAMRILETLASYGKI